MAAAIVKQQEQERRGAWSPASWRGFPARQIPAYDDTVTLETVEDTLRRAAPLVSENDIHTLKKQIAKAASGAAFLLQGGDCAETFAEFHPDNVTATFRLMQDMAMTIKAATTLPVTRIGRIAGQFAKPRSAAQETRNGVSLPSYKGDIVNDYTFTAAARRHDPERIIKAYRQSAATLRQLQALAHDGEDFFTAHEALLLPYEEALTRQEAADGAWLARSAHFLWVGDRTRQPDGAHVEFLRGIGNPVGIKCGPALAPDELLRLIDTLNPANQPGRLTLITRMGHNKIQKHLPELAKAVKHNGCSVAWVCDAMHGNTRAARTGHKTRAFEHIESEIIDFLAIHYAEGTRPAGVHLEMTARDVTECTGGAHGITEEKLPERYQTYCDPRLNASQSMELAALIGKELNKHFGPARAGTSSGA